MKYSGISLLSNTFDLYFFASSQSSRELRLCDDTQLVSDETLRHGQDLPDVRTEAKKLF